MKIKETDTQIANAILDLLEEHFRETLSASKDSISNHIKLSVISLIKAQPEYRALLGDGKLVSEFGLEGSEQKLNEILAMWAQDIVVTITKVKRAIKLRIEMIQSDFENVLNLEAAKQVTAKGASLEWLDWLLIQGDKTVIRDYTISSKVGPGRKSRTGLAIMVKNTKGKWSVPPEYAGTKTSNWVTRAINRLDDSTVESIIEKEIKARW